MKEKAIRILCLSSAFLLISVIHANAVTISGYLTILNVRSNESGFTVQVSQTVNSSCAYSDHLQVELATSSNYNSHVSMFLSAWTLGKQIRVYYEGCTSNGSVEVVGWVSNP